MKRIETFWEQIDINKLLSDNNYALEIYRNDILNRYYDEKEYINSFFAKLKR